MANNKKIDQEARKEELRRREELEKLIANTSQEITTGVDATKSLLPKRSEHFLDYHKVKHVLDKESTEIVVSIAEFYLDGDVIEKVPYVKQKTKVDQITVSSLLFQMKTAEHAIIKLLGEIDDGNLHPRTFEVLASLQRSKMEIVKHLAQFMIIMENAYKNFQEDYRIKKAETVDDDAEENDENFRMRGSKQLIQALQRVKENEFDSDSIEQTAKDSKNNKADGDKN
jgi:hypothetical protein